MNCNKDIKTKYAVRCSQCHSEWFEDQGAPKCYEDKEVKHADLEEPSVPFQPFVPYKTASTVFNGDAVDAEYSLKHYERP